MTRGTKDSIMVAVGAIVIGGICLATLSMYASYVKIKTGYPPEYAYLFPEATMVACGMNFIELEYMESKSKRFETKTFQCGLFYDGAPHAVVLEYSTSDDKWTVRYVGPPMTDHEMPLELGPWTQWKEER